MKPLLLSLLSTISVVLGLVGLVVIGWGLRRMSQASRTRKWPTTQGSILSSTTVSRIAPPVPRPGEDEEETAARPPQTLYRPEVTYTYKVGQRSFTGTALGSDEVEISSERQARDHAARYVPGSPVTVYYDPEDPQRALLEPGIQATSWVLPTVGVVFLIVTGALSFFIRWYSGR
ncbi:MAG TPA: DUF3592 domain-containing protein [Archangium sp.]|jgi:hypothetical protein|uniref:DUF3592 domain-containing protein n=1 Tax=Archangium sp. TaxID=1872627 RepID=UPI002ED9E4CF